MDLFEFVKKSLPKRDKLKQLIVTHTGLSLPAFIAAVSAGAATIAAITCYLKSTPGAAIDRDTDIQANGTKDTSEEAVNTDANGNGEARLDEEVQAQELVADIMASEYMQAIADEMATPVETPKDI